MTEKCLWYDRWVRFCSLYLQGLVEWVFRMFNLSFVPTKSNHRERFSPRGISPLKAVSKHSRRFAGLGACFLLVTVVFFLFLFDKFRLKHLLKHTNKKNLARIAVVASFGKYSILPTCFAQFFCLDVSIWDFYLHRRFGENLRCFWRRIRHD